MNDICTRSSTTAARCVCALGLAAVLPLLGCAAAADGGDDVQPIAQLAPLGAGCAAGANIALLSRANGSYVTADLGHANTPLLAEANHMLGWENFTVVDAGGGWVALRSNANGLYVSADLNAGGALEAGWATGIDDWEKFQFVSAGDGWYGIRSYANGLYASANLNQSATPVQAAWATTIQLWEEFQCVPYGTSPGGGRSKVLAYLAQISGHKAIAGQHNKFNSTPTNATDDVASITGLRPGLWSADFGFGNDAIANRGNMIAAAKAQWHAGAIVQLMYHACIPTGDEYCSWDDIGGRNPQHLSDDQWNALVTDGTALNGAWKARLDTLAVYLADLKAAGVAPLFRPLHEMNQGVFWWGGRGGSNGTRRLYQITHDYLVNQKGLDNLIWVWDVQDFGSLSSDVHDYHPGAAYFDVAALDIYGGGYDQWKYDAIRSVAGSAPVAVGECEWPPSSATLAAQPAWAFFMLWPDFVGENTSALPGLYRASNVITLDKMPGWN